MLIGKEKNKKKTIQNSTVLVERDDIDDTENIPQKKSAKKLDTSMIKNESGVASPTKRIQEKESKKNPRKTRRRQRNRDAWFRRRMQKAKNAGKEYQYKNNKGEWVTVPSKTVGKPCTCKAKCFENFDPEEIDEVFKSFWKLGDYDLQNMYLCNVIDHQKTKK